MGIDHKAALEAANEYVTAFGERPYELNHWGASSLLFARAYLVRERALGEAIAAIEETAAYYRRHNGIETAAGLDSSVRILRERLRLVA